MKRDPCSFLADVIDAGNAILAAVNGIDLDDYNQSRLIRSSVEREFIIIGEALSQLMRRPNTLCSGRTGARDHQLPQQADPRNHQGQQHLGLMCHRD